MDMLKAIVLGVIQGLTEFLPISSSGHLVIASRILNFQEPGIVFEVFLHCGTLVAVLFVFRHELRKMLRSFVVSASVRRTDPELAHFFNWNLQIVVATLPAVIVGLFLRHSIDRIFDTILVTFSMLAVTGVIMVLTRFIPDRDAAVNWPRALAVGMAQALAILPGISRSGSTIFTGMLVGINRETAARFSFIMSIPAILGAVVLKAPDLYASPPLVGELANIGAGTAASLVSGYAAIVLLLRIVRRGKLYWFGYYCLLVSGLGFGWHFFAAG